MKKKQRSGRLKHAYHFNILAIVFIGIVLSFYAIFRIFFSHAATSVTVAVNFNTTSVPAFKYYNQDASFIQTPKGPADQAKINAIGTKYERGFGGPGVIDSNGFKQYDFTNNGCNCLVQDGVIQQMKANGVSAVLGTGFPPSWNFNTSTCTPYSWANYTTELKDWYEHVKTAVDPNVVYVESINEPDWSGNHCPPIGQYGPGEAADFQYYDATASAARQTNIDLGLPKAGNPALKVGGPTIANPDTNFINDFLAHVKSNGDELDYISWHEYGTGPTPVVGGQWDILGNHPIQAAATTIDVKNKACAMNSTWCNIETLVTEWGYNSQNGDGAPSNVDAANNAAFDASALYQFMQGGLDKPFVFAQIDHAEYRRSLLVPANVNGTDGLVYPTYNMYKMWSMMKPTRVAATMSPGLDSSGLGVGAIATKASDGTSATIMAWDYTGPYSYNTPPVNIALTNLPSAFSGKAITVKRYVIDNTHSNWAHNGDNNLDQLSDLSLPAGTTSINGETLGGSGNGIELLVLTPSGTVSNPAPNLTSISPTSGTASGGTTVTLTGTNFISGASVAFGGVAATGETVSSSTSMTAVAPAHAAGGADVVITNPDGQTDTLTGAYTYSAVAQKLPDLIVTSVSVTPANPVNGGLVTFNATVKNQGTAATPAGIQIGVAFAMDGGNVVSWSDNDTTSLAPGASVTLTANGGPTPGISTWTATTGNHSVEARVDDAADVNRITESNEANNRLSKSFSVGAVAVSNADFNNSGKVDITDLSILAAHYNQNGVTQSQGDANNDGKVNVFDLSILASQWGT